MNWYYVEAGQQRGPVTEADLENLVKIGRIQPETLVWREGMANWQPYREMKPGAVPPPQLSPSAPFGAGASGAAPLDYAGFWIRFGAKFIDNLIIGLPLVVVIFVIAFSLASSGRVSGSGTQMPGMMKGAAGTQAMVTAIQLVAQLVFVVIAVLYNTFFLGKFGATPGKMVCKLRVVTPEGEKISYGRALGRSCAELLSGLICNIGYIIAAFDGEKRTLHDHIAGTRVVRRPQ